MVNIITHLLQVLQEKINAVKQHPIVIAIDGHSSSGKSTLAKDLARVLGHIHLDSGAMYRAVAYYFLQHKVDLKDALAVEMALRHVHLRFELVDGDQKIFLNGNDVSPVIRSQEVAGYVSEVAAISAVRKKLVTIQRELGRTKGIVMDGRDIGTVVFPDAEFKLYITAEMDRRAIRRHEELKSKGIDMTIDEVIQNLRHRDHIDSTRVDSPLRMAVDALLIDTTEMTHEQQLQKALSLLFEKIESDK